MKPDSLKQWVDQGFAAAARAYETPPRDFWPEFGTGGQGQATTWAWGTFLAAVEARFGNESRTLHFSATHGRESHVEAHNRLLTECWQPADRRKHAASEILVDFTVHDWNAPAPLLATAESEMHSQHGLEPSITRADDFSWDFYKLLLVRAPLRLFMCRVGAFGGRAGAERRDTLVRTLETLYGWYGELARDADLAAVVIAEDWREWKDSRMVLFHPGETPTQRLIWE